MGKEGHVTYMYSSCHIKLCIPLFRYNYFNHHNSQLFFDVVKVRRDRINTIDWRSDCNNGIRSRCDRNWTESVAFCHDCQSSHHLNRASKHQGSLLQSCFLHLDPGWLLLTIQSSGFSTITSKEDRCQPL